MTGRLAKCCGLSVDFFGYSAEAVGTNLLKTEFASVNNGIFSEFSFADVPAADTSISGTGLSSVRKVSTIQWMKWLGD